MTDRCNINIQICLETFRQLLRANTSTVSRLINDDVLLALIDVHNIKKMSGTPPPPEYSRLVH